MGDDIDLLAASVLPENVKKLRIVIDAHRKDHRGARTEADVIQLRKVHQMIQILPDHIILIDEGIPARQEDIVDLGMGLHILCHTQDLLRHLIMGIADHPLAETMTAVHGALAGRQHERRLGVLVLHTGQYRVVRFTARILMPVGTVLHRGRDTQPADRIFRVGRIDQIQIIRRNADRISLCDLPQCVRLFPGNPEGRQHLVDIPDTIVKKTLQYTHVPPPFRMRCCMYYDMTIYV